MRFLSVLIASGAVAEPAHLAETQRMFCVTSTGIAVSKCVVDTRICSFSEIPCGFSAIEHLMERYTTVRGTILGSIPAGDARLDGHFRQLSQSETLLDYMRYGLVGNPWLQGLPGLWDLLEGFRCAGMLAVFELYMKFPGCTWGGDASTLITNLYDQDPTRFLGPNVEPYDTNYELSLLVNDRFNGNSDVGELLFEFVRPSAIQELNVYALASTAIRLTEEDDERMASLIRKIDMNQLNRNSLRWLLYVAVFRTRSLRSHKLGPIIPEPFTNEMMNDFDQAMAAVPEMDVTSGDFLAVVNVLAESVTDSSLWLCPVGRVLQRIGYRLFGLPVSQAVRARMNVVCPGGLAVHFEPKPQHYLDALVATLRIILEHPQEGINTRATVLNLLKSLPLGAIELERDQIPPSQWTNIELELRRREQVMRSLRDLERFLDN